MRQFHLIFDAVFSIALGLHNDANQQGYKMFALNLRRIALGGLGLMVAGSTFAQTPAAVPAAPVDPIVVPAAPSPDAAPPATEPAPTPIIEPAPEPEVKPEPQPAPQPAPKPVKKRPPDGLKPGQFVWENRAAYIHPLRMVIVLDIQRMYVFDGDVLVGFTTVSTGTKGKETPTGVFKILQKKLYHESNLYANAPMPFMQRLTWDGIALHAGYNPGYPASHGCIRLPKIFAEALYDATVMDGEVVILESLSKPKPQPQPQPAPKESAPTPPVEPDQASPSKNR